MGARLRCASATMFTICPSNVSPPTRSARMTKLPEPLTVPPVTLSPTVFSTGRGSPVIMSSVTEGLDCRFTVHFSTLFCTTRASFRKNGTLLSCRLNLPRLRHFLDDFGECRFGRLLFCFPLTHTAWFHESGGVYWSIWLMYSEVKAGISPFGRAEALTECGHLYSET